MGLSTENCNSGAVVSPAGKNKWQPQGYRDTKVQLKTDDQKCATDAGVGTATCLQ